MVVCWQQWCHLHRWRGKQHVFSPEILVIFRQITRLDVDCILHGHHVTTMRNSNFTLGQYFNFQVWKYTIRANTQHTMQTKKKKKSSAARSEYTTLLLLELGPYQSQDEYILPQNTFCNTNHRIDYIPLWSRHMSRITGDCYNECAVHSEDRRCKYCIRSI
jgi:hypothetical protein